MAVCQFSKQESSHSAGGQCRLVQVVSKTPIPRPHLHSRGSPGDPAVVFFHTAPCSHPTVVPQVGGRAVRFGCVKVSGPGRVGGCCCSSDGRHAGLAWALPARRSFNRAENGAMMFCRANKTLLGLYQLSANPAPRMRKLIIVHTTKKCFKVASKVPVQLQALARADHFLRKTVSPQKISFQGRSKNPTQPEAAFWD